MLAELTRKHEEIEIKVESTKMHRRISRHQFDRSLTSNENGKKTIAKRAVLRLTITFFLVLRPRWCRGGRWLRRRALHAPSRWHYACNIAINKQPSSRTRQTTNRYLVLHSDDAFATHIIRLTYYWLHLHQLQGYGTDLCKTQIGYIYYAFCIEHLRTKQRTRTFWVWPGTGLHTYCFIKYL